MIYKYRARTASGTINSGSHEAASESAALSWIREQGWSPIAIETEASLGSILTKRGEQGAKKSILDIELFPQKVTLKDKNIIFKQMATMINAGITIAGTLDLLATQSENKTLKNTIVSMRDAVSSGVTLASAMARHPKIFNGLEVSLVRAGEEGGVLDVSMARLAQFVESQYALQKKIKSAMTYPTVVIFFTVLAMVGLCMFIVPMFRQAFDNIGAELPGLTAAIFAFSDFLLAYWFTLPIPFIALWFIIKYAYKTPAGRRFLDGRKIKFPGLGDIAFKGIMSRSFRTFATLVAAGVSILDGIEMSGNVADNVLVGEAFKLMRERAQNGIPLSVTIKEQKLFPKMVAHMVAVGEETGQIDDVLAKVADWYDMELDEKIKALTSIIEPVLIVVVGLGVGTVVGAIFIPLVQAMQQFM